MNVNNSQVDFNFWNFLSQRLAKQGVLTIVIKAVIFDLDGTLKEFNLDIRACRVKVITFLTKQGFSHNFFSVDETVFDMLRKAEQHLEKKVNRQQLSEIKKRVLALVEDMELEAAKKSKLLLGVPETLEKLKNMKLKLGLCTISGERATCYILKRLNIGPFFDVVVTRDSVTEMKPHPAQLEAALLALDVKPQEAMLVGDSVKDVACALQLNVLAVGVTTGLSSVEKLKRSGVHYIASSINDVPRLILDLQKQIST